MVAEEKIFSDKEIIGQIECAGEQERVSPLDPDFLVFALPFALLVDMLDIVLEFTGFLVFPKIIGIAMDISTFAIIGGWIYWRTGRIMKRKEDQKKALQKVIAKKGAGMKKQLAKGIKGPLRRVLFRAGIAFLGEIIWFLGIIPFWTIVVILTLREK